MSKPAEGRKRGNQSRNLVAKHAMRYNQSAVHRDRKKDAKRGVEKHKARSLDRAYSFLRAAFYSTLS